jgi:hypothetical protein
MTLALGIGLVLTAWSCGTLTTVFGLLRWAQKRAAAIVSSRASRTGQLAGPVEPIRLRGAMLLFLLAWTAVFLAGLALIAVAVFRANSN